MKGALLLIIFNDGDGDTQLRTDTINTQNHECVCKLFYLVTSGSPSVQPKLSTYELKQKSPLNQYKTIKQGRLLLFLRVRPY